MEIKEREQINKAVETLESEGWKEVILPDLIASFKKLRNELESGSNSRETDLLIKGKMMVYREQMDLHKTYKNK